MTSSFKNLPFSELDNGDVLVRVDYTSINFKDALAAVKGAGVVKEYPIIPGIDLAGTVVKSDSSAYKPGDKVIVTSYDLGLHTTAVSVNMHA